MKKRDLYHWYAPVLCCFARLLLRVAWLTISKAISEAISLPKDGIALLRVAWLTISKATPKQSHRCEARTGAFLLKRNKWYVVAFHERLYSKHKQHVSFLALFAPLLPALLALALGANLLLCTCYATQGKAFTSNKDIFTTNKLVVLW